MKRYVVGLLVGLVLGILVTLAVLASAGGMYEYRYLKGFTIAEERALLTGDPGRWQPVPGAEWWFRRSRVHLALPW